MKKIIFSQVKKDFLVFKNQPGLVYLDTAATSLKPKQVVDKIVEYYSQYPANIHRGAYQISERATREHEESREIVAKFINALPSEIVFTRNTTESLNILAFGLAENFIKKGDEIVVSIAEHHSNFVPWQVVCREKGAKLRILDVDDQGKFDMNGLERMMTKKTKVVSLAYASNVLGAINPIEKISRIIKSKNPKTLFIVDGAKVVPHLKVDLSKLACDFFVFSGHKMLGPTGVGVLWGKQELLEKLTPFNFGGGMVERVSDKNSKFKKAPWKFEAGTPNIASVIALKEAIFYLERIGMENIQEHCQDLTDFAFASLKNEFKDKIKIFGPDYQEERAGLLSFTFKNLHPHDVSYILDREKICLRAGHHCAMPLHKRLGVLSTNRASFYFYNRKEDVDKLILGLKKVEKILGKN